MSATVDRQTYTNAVVEFWAASGIRINATFPIRLDEDSLTFPDPDTGEMVTVEVVE